MRDRHGDPHKVLGVSPGAPGEEIKRAFRRLAKQLHPDLHPGDAGTELRFREVVGAYQALSGSDAVAAVRPQRRPGLPAQAATMAAVFLLTVGSVATAALWWAPGEAPPPPAAVPAAVPTASGASKAVGPSPIRPGSAPASESSEAGPPPIETGRTGALSAGGDTRPAPDRGAYVTSGLGSGSAPASAGEQERARAGQRDLGDEARSEAPRKPQTDEGRGEADAPTRPSSGAVTLARAKARAWADFRNARFGFSLAYPTDLFVDGPARTNEGTVFRTRDGRASLTISAAITASTLAAHRRSLMDGAYRGAAFDYTPRRAYWFVLSGTLADSIFYQRVTVSCDRRAVHSWKLVYPVAERDLFDAIVEEIHRRYTHSNGAGARCGEVSR
jgi:hypothetical protein